MSIDRTTKKNLDKGDFQAIEDEWLNRIGDEPEHLDYFIGVARALVGNGEESRARSLLELLDEQLREQEMWTQRLEMLNKVGSLLHPKAEKLHPMIVATLRRIYDDRPSFDGLAEKLGLHKASQDTKKTWDKVDRIRTLIDFDIGLVVWMQGKGVGKVVEVNLDLEAFRIDFEKHKALAVGFRAAAKLLKALPPEHVLRRKLEDPEGMRKLAADDPPEMLHLVLESNGEPMSAGDIRADVSGVVPDAKWSSWWTAARKHPQVVTHSKGRQTYSWAASSEDAEDAAWLAFQRADPRRQLDLLRREGERAPKLREKMRGALLRLGANSQDDPSLAFEIWFALERSGGAPEDAAWSAENLLLSDAVVATCAGIQDRLLRERAYTMVHEKREDWAAIFAELLAKENDPRALNVLYEALYRQDPDTVYRFVDQILAKPRSQPGAFVWLAERAAEDEELRQRNSLQLLQQTLHSMQDEVFASFRAARLVPLVESGGSVPRLLSHLSEEQAEAADRAIERAPALEDYQREALRNALHLRFASLQRKDEEMGLYALPASIETKRAEFNHLKSVELPTNRKAIEEARAMGDLRENFEYKSARQRHEYLSSRLAALNSDLSRVQPIQPAGLDLKDVRIGTRVHLHSSDASRVLTILGPWESKPEEDIISYESELAGSLLGKSAGDEVEVAGTAYTIREIERYD